MKAIWLTTFFTFSALAPAAMAANTYTVKKGDSLYAIGKRHGLSPEAIAKANGISKSQLIQPGQTLKLSANEKAIPKAKKVAAPKHEKSAKVAQKPLKDSDEATEKKHVVKKKHVTKPKAKAAPKKKHHTAEAAPKKKVNKVEDEPIKKSPDQEVPAVQERPAAPAAAPQVPAQPTPAPSVAPTPNPAPAPAPALTMPPTTSNVPTQAPAAPAQPSMRLVKVAEKITLGDFAKKNNTTLERLNELNGLSLSADTLMDVGSELYVPF